MKKNRIPIGEFLVSRGLLSVEEAREVAAEHPDTVQRLLGLAECARQDLGDTDCEAANQRPAGWVDDPKPQLLASD